MILVSVRLGSNIVGRCDAKCYDAKHDHCQCVCGGVNHGKGIEKAQENTLDMARLNIDDPRFDFPMITKTQIEEVTGLETYPLFRTIGKRKALKSL